MSWTGTSFFAALDVARLFHPTTLAILGDGASEGVRVSPEGDHSPSVSTWGGDDLEVFENSPSVPDVALVRGPSDRMVEACRRKKVPWVFLLDDGPALADEGDWETVVFGPLPLGGALVSDSIAVSGGELPYSAPAGRPGIGYISQSGSVGVSVMAAASSAGVPFRYGVTTGRPFDGTTAEIGRWLLKNGGIGFLVLYIETLSEGAAFLDLAREAHHRGVPLAVLRGHGDEADPASTTDDGVWRTIAEQFGLVLLEDVEDLLDLCVVAERVPRPRRRGAVSVLSLSGGMGALLSRACLSAGLTMADLPDELDQRLRAMAVDGARALSTATDRGGANVAEGLEGLVRALDRGDETDILMVAIPALTSPLAEAVEETMRRTARALKKPVLCWALPGPASPSSSGEPPFFQSPRRCARAMAAYVDAVRVPVLPEPQRAPSTEPVLGTFPRELNEHDATRLIEAYGLSLVRQKFCRSLDEVLEAGLAVGYPVVIKVVSTDIFSKEAARGIALDLRTEEELQNAYGRILERARRSCPDAVIDGVLVQEMVEEGIECMIGMKRDPVFGPVVAVGLGGALYDMTKDLALRLAPVDFDGALSMVESLKGYRLFSGLRGRETLDFRALAHEVVKVSVLACAEPELLLLDIDSAFVTGRGVRIADVYAFRKRDERW